MSVGQFLRTANGSRGSAGGLRSSHTCGRLTTARRQQRPARHPDKLQVVRHAMEKVRSDNFSRTRSADKEPIERGLGRIEVQGDGLGPVQLNASSRTQRRFFSDASVSARPNKVVQIDQRDSSIRSFARCLEKEASAVPARPNGSRRLPLAYFRVEQGSHDSRLNQRFKHAGSPTPRLAP